jgi:uncharacterized protein YkwD
MNTCARKKEESNAGQRRHRSSSRGPISLILVALLISILPCATTSVHAEPAPPASEAAPSPNGLEEIEAKILALANVERTHQGLVALSMNPTLQLAARGHSSEMGRLNYFDHESPNKERKFPWDRMNLLGVDSNDVGENIFMTDGHPINAAAEMAVRGWLSSVHHRENLLNPKFKATGLGMSKVQGRIYFTQIFASDLSPLETTANGPK